MALPFSQVEQVMAAPPRPPPPPPPHATGVAYHFLPNYNMVFCRLFWQLSLNGEEEEKEEAVSHLVSLEKR